MVSAATEVIFLGKHGSQNQVYCGNHDNDSNYDFDNNDDDDDDEDVPN